MNSLLHFLVFYLIGVPAYSAEKITNSMRNAAATNLQTLERAATPKANLSLKQLTQIDRAARQTKTKAAFAKMKNHKSNVTRNVCLNDEKVYRKINKDIFQKLQAAIANKNIEQVLQHVSKKNFIFDIFTYKPATKIDGIIVMRASAVKKSSSHQAFQDSWRALFSRYSEIEFVELAAKEYAIGINDRIKKSMTPKEITYKVAFDIRGTSKKERLHDRGTFVITTSLQKSKWTITGWEVETAERLASNRKPAYIERTKEYGLAKLPVELRREAIRRGGYSLSIADINADNNVDLLVGGMNGGQLFLNSDDNKFKKIKSIVEKETFLKASAFADFDNDGDRDLVLTRFIDASEASVKVYYNDGNGNFSSKGDNVEKKWETFYAMPLAVADLNSDGFLDFYVGYPGHKDFTHFEGNRFTKKNVEGLYINNGSHRFMDLSDRITLAQRNRLGGPGFVGDAQTLYPHAAMAIDYDHDNDLDIVVIDDRNNLSPIYNNNNGFQFSEVANDSGAANSGFGMGIDAGDINNDGYTDLIMTNVVLNAVNRMNKSCNNNVYESLVQRSAVKVFLGSKSGKFADATKTLGLTDTGEALGGVTLVDYNNDGLQDIYLVNGLWSGSSRDHDIADVYARARESIAGTGGVRFSPKGGLKKLAQSHVMGILAAYKDKKTGDTLSMAGYQRNRLFRNMGDGTFLEVGFIEGIDSIADGYMAATADLNKDGRMELVLRNADPGSQEYTFAPVQVFENQFEDGENSIVLSLESASGKRDAMGAFVIAEHENGRKQVRHLIANHGAIQSEPVIHIGLGEEDELDRLTIHWPNGTKKIVKNIEAGRYHFVAPNQRILTSKENSKPLALKSK